MTRVLIVDPGGYLGPGSNMFASVFEALGHEVTVADGVDQALELLDNQQFDLLEIEPHGHGWDGGLRVVERAISRGVAVIPAAGSPYVRGLRNGLEKPLRVAQLKETIESALQDRANGFILVGQLERLAKANTDPFQGPVRDSPPKEPL